ncbi:hypothetical protein A3A39_02440 [Candidatus Kaiserbacteria bacterium RIFCSPLOWO2_01_FULL_54_13]|uniref:ABC transporter ATP-binding protein n=1 Tax=Candidatus Kaiserbacteria bacterium RIFCSPLOWO2_01_FULL_54_13 TaxID=1798512 RepID=A0A1F6F148_9BACT|nr:MAG: hypothetical protein A3A39_02440 [Candidatus Kaiserbacteria bacterium RIFCSPLOWO2_01_FULL_54_13]
MTTHIAPPRFARLRSVAHLARRAYAPYLPHIALLTVLGFVGGILEGIGINAVIPLLTFVLGLDDPVADSFSGLIRTLFNFAGVPFVPKFLLAFIVLLFIGKTLVSLVLSYIQILITTEYERSTREKLFTVILTASWPILLRQKLGDLETALMVDTPAATGLLGRIAYTTTLVTSILMYLVVAFSISPVVTIATFLISLFVFMVLRPLLNRVHALSRSRAAIYSDTMHHTTEHVDGLKSIKAFGVEAAAVKRALGLFQAIKERTTTMQMFQQFATQVVTPIGIAYIALIFGLAYKTPFISFAALPAILYLVYRIFTYAQQMQGNLQALTESIPHLERVIAIEDQASVGQEDISGARSFVFKKELSFDRVSFSYDLGTEVLHAVSFSIQKGTMVGLIGPSGAGKTTCVDLVLRLLKPTKGSITLDGVDVREIKLADWRRRIAYVAQDLFLIHGTIRDNIRFYDASISDEDVWAAAHMSHAEEFMRRFPEGLDTMVGERGITLSAGQRQRLVIARALARKPDVLILDEATSALDAESESHIKRAIEELKGRITIIAIAHRLSTIMDSDELIVLDRGRVVETGEPSKLLKDTGSYYYKVNFINQ